MHAPEFPFERDAGNVADAIEQNGLEYPVVQDNDMGTWNAYGNQYWPAKYLIDAEGQVRYVHFGEGDDEETEQAIRTLLREKGDAELGAGAAGTKAESANPAVRTPETYLGALRADGWVNGQIRPGAQDFGAGARLAAAQRVRLSRASGRSPARAPHRARTPGISADFGAEKVFLVLGSPEGPREVEVLLDGRPIPDAPRRRGRPRRRGDDRPTSASTGSSICRRPAPTSSSSASSRGSTATRSRSADPQAAGFCPLSTRL